VEQARVRN